MRKAPLLILAYNRPNKVRGLIEALRPQAPDHVLVAVDGPKPGNADDATKVRAVQDAVAGIDWGAKVEVRFRPSNLGLRRAVVDAVSWANSQYGQVIVLEEDIVVGPDFIPYASHMLEKHRADERIAHISGYNVVPQQALGMPQQSSRLSIYPESIAWATWDRAWQHYDDDLAWALSCSVSELAALTGSRAAALRWKQNFSDADAGRISTWAYRWIASMWARGSLALSPNHNLVTYVGQDEGTHTVTAPPWEELPLYTGSREELLMGEAERDLLADDWASRTVFRGTPFGVVKGVAISAVLEARRRHRESAARRA